MRFFIFTSIIFSAVLSFADSTNLTSFLTSTEGSWEGTGTVLMQNMNGVAPGTYDIQVKLSSVREMTEASETKPSVPSDTWDITTAIFGMPHNPGTPTLTQYQITADGGLNIISAQYLSVAEIAKYSNATELGFTTIHEDPMTHRTVTVVRDTAIDGTDTIHVVSDIYQNDVQIEHFEYALKKPQPSH